MEIFSSNTERLEITAQDGAIGAAGSGGRGGRGGKNGRDMRATFHWFSFLTDNWQAYLEDDDPGKQNDGRRGEDNKNAAGQESPKVVPNKLTSSVVNDYKSFLMENLGHLMLKRPLSGFYETLNGNPELNTKYDVFGLANELVMLQESYTRFSNDVNFLPIYKGFLERVGKFAENIH